MRESHREPVFYLAKLALLAAVYYAAARLGLQYASIGHSVSLVWPPTGIAVVAMLLLGDRYWPGVALGAFLANAATPIPLAAAVGIAAGNTFEALTAAYVFRRAAGPRPQLDELRHVWTLVFLALPLGALVSAVIGVTSLWATGALAERTVLSAMAVWWIGDLLGGLVIAPVFFTWRSRSPVSSSTRGILEIAALCLGTAAAIELGLGAFFSIPLFRELDYTYLLFPFVFWAGLRFGPRGASLMTLTVSVVAVWHTAHGAGPFVAGTAGQTLFAVACYLAIVAVTGLGLAAAVHWERGRTSTALRQSEERLRIALDAARMGIWFWSVQDNTLTWDERLRKLYGFGPDDRVSTYDDFVTRIHPDDRAFVEQSVHKALHEGGGLDYEFRVVLPDGRVRWIADQGEVGRDERGRAVYMTGVCTDVTERRTTEDRLRLAHRMDSVGRLAGGVAHEANNQMSVVLGAADFVLRHPDLTATVRADVLSIRKAAERTAAVTAQLLAFSRRQILKPEILDLNAVIEGWEPVLRRAMGEDCVVTLRLQSGIGFVKADPGQLEQALLNLALNARDAMPRGGTLTLETFSTHLTTDYTQLKSEVTIRTGPYAVLAVSDTGQGMDKPTLNNIFEPFFTTKGPGHGTGLGLATVYGIVKQSDGYVWAYSEPGQGTTFKIYLPLTTEVAHTAQAEPITPRPATGESILVVEDEPYVRSVAKRALEEAGYRVLEAENGSEALETLAREKGRIDLVLTDVVMPGMNGPELAGHMTDIAPGTPVLFTSGYPDGEIARRGLLPSGAAFIQKPFAPDAIVQIVGETLDAGRRSVAKPISVL